MTIRKTFQGDKNNNRNHYKDVNTDTRLLNNFLLEFRKKNIYSIWQSNERFLSRAEVFQTFKLILLIYIHKNIQESHVFIHKQSLWVAG